MTTNAQRIEWMRRLPEMGVIHKVAREDLTEIDERIAKLQEELAALGRDAEAVIARAEKECAGLWTPDEIRLAKEETC